MLPGFRILLALVALSFAILIFGFGALALLRTAHQNLANRPTWQPAWRTPLEIANARREDRQPPSDTQTLALLRVDPPTTHSEPSIESSPADTESTPSPNPPAAQLLEQARSNEPSPDAATDVKPQQTADVSPANPDGPALGTGPTETVAVPGDKPIESAAAPPPIEDHPDVIASNAGDAPAAADAPGPPAVQLAVAAPPAAEPNAAPPATKVEEPAPEPAEAETPAPKTESPVKLATLPDMPTSTSEVSPRAGRQSTRRSDAAELRAKRRARARLRARRFALARARAARLTQIQQATATSSSFYNSSFSTTTPSTSNATYRANPTPNATPFGAPRAAP